MNAEKIFLIGYRGSGKTSVGRTLAERLERRFVDSDQELEARARSKIVDIFREQGEPAFRDLESKTLRSIAQEPGVAVVATGGGIVLRPENVAVLQAGWVVWLTAASGILQSRIAADEAPGAVRPALRGQSAVDEVEAILAERTPLYDSASHVKVSTEDRSLAEIVEDIVASLPAP
ncbi:MAG: shikimate kinase [Planctomycetota bacterium]